MDTGFFTGEFNHTLDTQRRVAIPSAWRKQTASDTWFLIPGKDGLLQLIPSEQFTPFFEKVRKASFTNAAQQKALALFAANIQTCKSDKQGRIQLSAKLLEHAGIADDLVLVGVLTNIQVWNPERWTAEQVNSGDTYLDVVQLIAEENDNPLESLMTMMQGGGKK